VLPRQGREILSSSKHWLSLQNQMTFRWIVIDEAYDIAPQSLVLTKFPEERQPR